MPNPVTDGLIDWQDNADGADTNQPVNSTIMSDGAAGDLDGELRRIKSEIRGESLLKSWERWLGVRNLAGTGNVAFTYVNATTFTINDNFSGSGRVIALPGRVFAAYGPGGAYIGFGIVKSVNWSNPTTTVTVFTIDNPLNNTLQEIRFGIYPNAAPGPTILSASAYLINPIITLGSNLWYNCPGGAPVGFTLALKKWPFPRSGVLSNLYVEQLPVGGPTVTVRTTIYINGVALPAFFCDVVGAPAQASNLTECVYVQAGDLLTFEFANQSATTQSGHVLASVEFH